MQSKTFTVPNISCGHCVHTVEMEVGDIPGVKSVKAEQDSKQVVVEWGEPATWEQIEGVDNPLMPQFLREFMIEKHKGATTALNGFEQE